MRTLITADRIENAVHRLAEVLNQEYRDEPLTLVGVLTGCVVLLSDLIRKLDMPVEINLIKASSYRGTATTPGEVRIVRENLAHLRDREVLLVDDIFDTGHTLREMMDVLGEFEPRSIRSAVLLWKTSRREVETTPDHYCFQIPDEFVVGYGLDYNGRFRQLPDICVLESNDLEK